MYRLDRISRSVGDFSGLIDQLTAYKTSFISIKEQFDTSTPMGRAMMNIAAVFAQLERETIAERVRDNDYMLARTGRWLGGVTPFGYRSVKVSDGKKSYFRLEQDKKEIIIVKKIFDKYSEMRSMSKLATYLTNNNITPRSGRNFSVNTIRKILTNPVYCVADEAGYNYFKLQNCNMCCAPEDCCGKFGFIGYGKTRQNPGSDRTAADSEQWLITVGRHKGIISGKNFADVQKILSENADSKIKFKQSHNPAALLPGILFCSCGSYMRSKYYRENQNGVKPYGLYVRAEGAHTKIR